MVAGAALAPAPVLEAVEEGGLLGEDEPRAACFRLELDSGERNREEPLVMEDVVAVDQALVRNDVAILGEEGGDLAARQDADEYLFAADAKVQRTPPRRPGAG